VPYAWAAIVLRVPTCYSSPTYRTTAITFTAIIVGLSITHCELPPTNALFFTQRTAALAIADIHDSRSRTSYQAHSNDGTPSRPLNLSHHISPNCTC
jgi:hypothetical protein